VYLERGSAAINPSAPPQPRIELALTANPAYALLGLRPGGSVTDARWWLKRRRPLHLGETWWYFVGVWHVTDVVAIRRGVVMQVGIATRALTRSRAERRTLIERFLWAFRSEVEPDKSGPRVIPRSHR